MPFRELRRENSLSILSMNIIDAYMFLLLLSPLSAPHYLLI